MTALPKLTRLEMDVLAGCYASDYTDGAESFAIWSWSMVPMITTEKQRSGVVASLVKKGIVTCGGSGSKDDDNTIDVTDLGIKVARHLGIYNDKTGYNKAVHAALVATPAQITKAVDKVLAKAAPQWPVLGTADMKMAVRLGWGVVEVLQLDDASVRKDLGLEIDFSRKSFIEVIATRSALAYFANCCQNRISSQYDQPLWYMSAAKAAMVKINSALEAK